MMSKHAPTLPLTTRNRICVWVASLRLQTLPLACCGIVTGNALAWSSGLAWRGAVFWAALATASLLQILANLANDYGDFSKSADTPRRLGARRGMQLGLITPEEMRRALWLTVALCLCCGGVLLYLACKTPDVLLVFVGLGAVSIFAALTYTLGRYAYGYHGLGDVSVLVFFGWVAVGGSFYLQTQTFHAAVLLPATACGLLSVLVLNINNIRDLHEDRLSGKITLAVRLGAVWARRYHLVLLTTSLLFLTASAWQWGQQQGRFWVWLFLFALPLFYKNALTVLRNREAQSLHSQLGVAIQIGIVALGGFALGLTI
ncbi:MAG: 1,4-dihydroxy-2-naphthoate octaprenyltransferase [Zoogloeaceae bacterium]|jgi:1,4-dihydroxy-2-naphthoate octaprenyltransferase|nr:1,4-dihydroxy-2-naphthoate octaprenyltransferase [Zoogloeaceae bacterium]